MSQVYGVTVKDWGYMQGKVFVGWESLIHGSVPMGCGLSIATGDNVKINVRDGLSIND